MWWKLPVSTVSMWVSVFVRGQESRRPASQLWSSFFTLLSSLTWALVSGGAADSAAWPAADVAPCSSLVLLDSISSSESSSSFSLSISSFAYLFSTLRPWEKKVNVTQHIFWDKQQVMSSHAEIIQPAVMKTVKCQNPCHWIWTHEKEHCAHFQFCWLSEAPQKFFRPTDLASVTEMSSDCTNIEQRKEVEGKTWAGVCRSCHKQTKQKQG